MAEVDFDKKWPFIFLGFEVSKRIDEECIGDCIFCDGNNKLHINKNTGQWSCKGGDCGKQGNVYTFIREWYASHADAKIAGTAKKFVELSKFRGLPVEALKSMGIVYLHDVDRWAIPVFNEECKVVNLRFYTMVAGSKTIALTGMAVSLGGMEKYNADDTSTVYICEGEWDAKALEVMLQNAEEEGLVLWVPGSDTFKKEWADLFSGRKVVFCYDHDPAGERGVMRGASRLYEIAESIWWVKWPTELPKKFDIRDFYHKDGNMSLLHELIEEYVYLETSEEAKEKDAPLPHISNRTISYDDVAQVFERHMKFTDDMRMALKLICSVVYSNNLASIPLWIHLTAPAGTGKTELLMSFSECRNAVIRSTITPRSLVSGFSLPGGKDPSLIPLLFGKTFVLKDYTEILQMNKGDKEEVDGILRGAYDGSVGKDFGNGVKRHYHGSFSMVTGVTHEIFAEARASLGERFLIFHMVKGVAFAADDIIYQALQSSGNETTMKSELSAAMKSFVEFSFIEDDLPPLTETMKRRLVGISQVVASLRAGVARDFREEKVLYRPQNEMGTRLAKQFRNILVCLGACNADMIPTDYDYTIVARTALDSCKGFNLEIAQFVADSEKPVGAKEISEGIGIPLTSIRMALEDLEWLKVLEKEVLVLDDEERKAGRPSFVYTLTEFFRKNWFGGGLEKAKEIRSEKPRPRMRWKKRQKEVTEEKQE